MNQLNRKTTYRLAEQGKNRTVHRLPDGQFEVTWHRIALRLRLKDLLLLYQALQLWMADSEREWARSYCLRLNDCAMFFTHDEMPAFVKLIDDACCRVVHCPIHWADLRVEIVPYTGTIHLDAYRLN